MLTLQQLRARYTGGPTEPLWDPWETLSPSLGTAYTADTNTLRASRWSL